MKHPIFIVVCRDKINLLGGGFVFGQHAIFVVVSVQQISQSMGLFILENTVGAKGQLVDIDETIVIDIHTIKEHLFGRVFFDGYSLIGILIKTLHDGHRRSFDAGVLSDFCFLGRSWPIVAVHKAPSDHTEQ